MASSSLTRTVTASSATSYTVSFWIKINDVNWSSTPYLWSVGSTAGNGIFLDSGDRKIKFFRQSTSSLLSIYDGALRDCNAFYHVVWSVNNGTGTAYVNGITGNSHSSIPALNDNTGTKISVHDYVGGTYNNLDCVMSHFHFIDGTAYDASAFGETDATTGIWKPKTAPSVTYGTNGFFLKFENSGAFGTDSSGNGNNFTVNGTMTQTIDTPSNVFATWNALDKHASSTLSNGNTKYATSGTSQYEPAKCTLGFSAGKYYSEHQINSLSTTACFIGIYGTSVSGQSQSEMDTLRFSYNVKNGEIIKNASNLQTGLATFTTNDILGIEVDCDSGTLKFYKNGTQVGTTITDSDISSTEWTFGTQPRLATFSSNFGNGYFGTTAVASAQNPDDGIGIFEYSVSTGYKALCTESINAQEYS